MTGALCHFHAVASCDGLDPTDFTGVSGGGYMLWAMLHIAGNTRHLTQVCHTTLFYALLIKRLQWYNTKLQRRPVQGLPRVDTQLSFCWPALPSLLELTLHHMSLNLNLSCCVLQYDIAVLNRVADKLGGGFSFNMSCFTKVEEIYREAAIGHCDIMLGGELYEASRVHAIQINGDKLTVLRIVHQSMHC